MSFREKEDENVRKFARVWVMGKFGGMLPKILGCLHTLTRNVNKRSILLILLSSIRRKMLFSKYNGTKAYGLATYALVKYLFIFRILGKTAVV